jgi:type II secretory pathway pseudopilin PulG
MKQKSSQRRDDTMNIPSTFLARCPASRRGFSFAEVMFAVIILGIGFIMVAAIFPVAIQQTRLTVDESTAAAVARQATAVLQQVVVGSEDAVPDPANPGQFKPLFPPTVTGTGLNVFSIRTVGFSPINPFMPQPLLWDTLKGNLISTSDRRFAWTAAYSRQTGSPFIQVYIFVLQQRNRPLFEQQDFHVNAPYFNLQPRRISIQVTPAGGSNPDPDLITITQNGRFAAEGTFVVTAGSNPNNAGRVYRLGAYRGPGGGGERYEVDPGYDVPDTALGGAYVGDAWIVGRGFDPTNPNPVPTGPAMDVAFYTTYLTVN